MEFLLTALAIFSLILTSVLILNYLLVKHYTDSQESTSVSTLTTVISLSITLLSVLLIPVDIYLTSSKASLMSTDDFSKVLMGMMSFMLFASFILVPFSYFYTEEVLDDYSAEVSTCSKVLTAGKYTAFTNLFTLVLLVSGLSFKLQAEDWGQGKEWVKQLFDLESSSDKALSFCVACLTVFGGGLWSVYTSYGMAVLPSLMIWGSKSGKDHIREINFNLSQIEDKIKEIEMKPNKTHRKVIKEKKDLEKEQKRMIKISEKLKNSQDSFLLVFIQRVILPFRIIIGSVFALMSVSFMLSLLISCVNRLMYSDCGYKCGFMTDKNILVNPFDYFLVQTSPYFPLDYLIFIVLVTYKYIASLFAIISVGIRAFCVQIFPIKPRKTLPQAMLLLSVIIMFIFLGISMEILTVFPIYSTFGYQKFEDNGKSFYCSFEHFGKSCMMTSGSQIFNKLSLSIPMFGLLVYVENWVFVAYFLAYGYRGMRDQQYSLLDDMDEDEDV